MSSSKLKFNMKDKDKRTTKIIAWIALIISLTGGIPGIVSTCKSVSEKPKLNFILRNAYSGGVKFNKQDNYSFVLLIFSIGNKGHNNFQRYGNPKIEAKINNKWVGLRLGFVESESFESMPDKRYPDIINTLKIPDYFTVNKVIPVNETIDVYLFAVIDAGLVTAGEINSVTEFRLTLKDVKNKKYTHIFERK